MNDDIGERDVGRIVHPLAVLHLALDQGVEIVLGRALDGVVVGMVSLHEDGAGKLAASGASGDLGEELEDALGSAKVRQSEGKICTDDSYQRDPMDVMALGDHLRADEQVDLAGMEAHEEALHVRAAAHGVSVHAADACAGKDLLKPLLALLRSRAEEI